MRYQNLKAENMTTRQLEVANAIEQRWPKELRYPYMAMLCSPEMADRTQLLGEHLRFGLRVPERLRILAVLVAVGRHHCSEVNALLSQDSVKNAMLAPEKIHALAQGARPAAMTEDEAVVYEFSMELVNTGRVKDASYDALVAHLGREIALELVAVCGYTMLMTNVASVTQTSISQDKVQVLA